MWTGYEGKTKRDFVALLWELKGTGMLSSDEAIYGCLNAECAGSLKSGLVANQMIMMFVILGLAFLNMFSIGLASHTMKFDIHYKTNVTNAFIFIALIGIIAVGALATFLTDFHSLSVNPDSISLPKNSRMDLPSLDFAAADLAVQSNGSIEFNESPWY